MKKYYSLVAITTLSVALLGNATSTGASNTVKADSIEVGTSNSLKTVTSSGNWEISPFGEPFYKMSGTLPEGLTSSVQGVATDNQTGEEVSYIPFNGYEQSKSFDIEVRPGTLHVEHNPTHSYTLKISNEDGSFSQDIYIPPFNGNSDESKQSEGSSSTESSSSSVRPNQIAPSESSSSPSSESKTEVEKIIQTQKRINLLIALRLQMILVKVLLNCKRSQMRRILKHYMRDKCLQALHWVLHLQQLKRILKRKVFFQILGKRLQDYSSVLVQF